MTKSEQQGFYLRKFQTVGLKLGCPGKRQS